MRLVTLSSSVALLCSILLPFKSAAAQENDVTEHKVASPVLAQVSAPALEITSNTDDQIIGVLTGVSLRVSFTSRRTRPLHSSLRIRLGETVFVAEADLDAKTRTIDGRGRAISLEQRTALRALTGELERLLDPNHRRLSPDADFLFRMVSYLAEAPVGFPINRHIVSLPPFDVLEPLLQAASLTCPADYGPEQIVQCVPCDGSCECDGGDGVVYLPAGCGCAATELWHDASPDHCFCSEILVTGCNLESDCLGRCGPGCGILVVDGAGSYTKDCAEHDRCCGIHGGCFDLGDPFCGDEWWDAADDFLFSAQNCNEGCVPPPCGDGICEASETCVSCPSDCGLCAPPRLYVNQDAAGLNDGSSWGDAYVDLQDALAHAAAAPAVSEIWVAAGTYTPAPVGGDRAATFTLLNGVAIYGGFAGGEADLAQRDIVLNPTILSGDLNFNDAAPAPAGAFRNAVRELISAAPAGRSLVNFQMLNRIVTGRTPNDTPVRIKRGSKTSRLHTPDRSSRDLRSNVAVPVSIDGAELRVRRLEGLELGTPDMRLATQGIIVSDNSLHVVTASGTDASAILDGFTITGGNADGAAFPDNAGGGIYNLGGLAAFRSCRIQSNHAAFLGGGMFNASGGDVTVIGCGFTNNTSSGLGGGVYNFNGSSPTFSNCAFIGNRAETLGGGMANVTECFPILVGTSFQSNIAVAGGGGLFNFENSNATLDGCNFSGNLATQGGAVFTIDASPVFTSCTFNNNNANLGGGMFEENSSSILIGCDLSGNSAFAGGAFFSTLSGTSFQSCTMIQNDAAVGGAMYNHQTSTFSMCSCDLSGNIGKVGGAMYNTDNASVSIVNTTFSFNTATGDVGVAGLGGAIVNIDNSNTVLTNCTLCSNTAPYGGAMLNIASSPQLSSCTLSGNVATNLGDAMFNGGLSFATVTNSIIWNANVAEIFEDATSVTTIDFSDVFGTWPGTGNIALDPLFFTTACADRSLSAVSPCIDAGDNGLLPPDTCDLNSNGNFAEPIPLDLAGNPRINGVIDMGAFELP